MSTSDPDGDAQPPVSLAVALTREHHEIDGGIDAFLAGLDAAEPSDEIRTAPLLTAMDALRRHIYLEEEFVFPPIRAGGLVMPIQVMLREHGQLWREMDALTALLGDDASGEPRQAARDDVVAACRSLLALLDRHNSKEEPIIYPHADSDLPESARAELAEFLRDGRTPEGWTCSMAGAGAS